VSRFNLNNFSGRLKAWLDFIFVDHAFLRIFWFNAHWLGRDLLRINQPWPYQLKWWRRHYGIRTVVNLRGTPDAGHYLLEREACEKLGLNMVDFTVFSREAPSREVVLGAKRLFDEIEYPALMHCKSGADRAGVMSVLYAHFRLGLPMKEALRQLSLRYGHMRMGSTGVLDFAIERYVREADATGQSIEDWVSRPEYDTVALKREFQSNWLGRLLTDRLLRRE
jgi:protein tyrosine/serine phosphatase